MAKITKDEYDALPDSVKSIFVETEGGYISQTEADAGLKEQNARLLDELKTNKNIVRQFEGLDAAEAKKALEEMKKVEDKKLADKGKFEELLKKIQDEADGKISAAQSDKDKILSDLKRERLTTFLVQKGVLPDRAKYALGDIDALTELVAENDGFALKLKDGIGDAKEMDGVIQGLKTTSPFLFAAQNASGSGASGSNSNGAGLDLDKMSPEQKLDYANTQQTT